MTRAEEKATKYANSVMLSVNHRVDVRDAFWDGYEQAEKDLALTWEDIKTIIQILADSDWYDFEINGKLWSEDFYKEVLKKYEQKRNH